jgi:hypothetical protein
VFGPAFTLRPMVADRLAGGDVVRDFFTLLFGARPFTLDPLPRHDESPDLAQLAMLRHFHLAARSGLKPAEAGARQRAGWHFAQRLAIAGGEMGFGNGLRPALHRALAARVQEAYRADAAALDAAFFPGDAPMTQALETATDLAIAEPQSFGIADHFDAEGCRQIGIWADLVGHLLQRAPSEWSLYLARLAFSGTEAGAGADGVVGAGDRRKAAR